MTHEKTDYHVAEMAAVRQSVIDRTSDRAGSTLMKTCTDINIGLQLDVYWHPSIWRSSDPYGQAIGSVLHAVRPKDWKGVDPWSIIGGLYP